MEVIKRQGVLSGFIPRCPMCESRGPLLQCFLELQRLTGILDLRTEKTKKYAQARITVKSEIGESTWSPQHKSRDTSSPRGWRVCALFSVGLGVRNEQRDSTQNQQALQWGGGQANTQVPRVRLSYQAISTHRCTHTCTRTHTNQTLLLFSDSWNALKTSPETRASPPFLCLLASVQGPHTD